MIPLGTLRLVVSLSLMLMTGGLAAAVGFCTRMSHGGSTTEATRMLDPAEVAASACSQHINIRIKLMNTHMTQTVSNKYFMACKITWPEHTSD